MDPVVPPSELETAGSRNEAPAVELTVSSHRRNLNSWSLEPGTWKLSLEAGNWSPETEKVPGTIWEIEAGAALQGASKSGPVSYTHLRAHETKARGGCRREL